MFFPFPFPPHIPRNHLKNGMEWQYILENHGLSSVFANTILVYLELSFRPEIKTMIDILCLLKTFLAFLKMIDIVF